MKKDISCDISLTVALQYSHVNDSSHLKEIAKSVVVAVAAAAAAVAVSLTTLPPSLWGLVMDSAPYVSCVPLGVA